MSILIQELKQSARMLANRPGFTSICVLILAIGIGANSAIFSLIDGVLLRSLPYKESDRLLQLWTQFPEDGLLQNPFSPSEFIDYRAQSKLFEGMAAYATGAPVIAGAIPERLQMAVASADLWRILRVQAAIGRTFLPEEDQPGRKTVVVLSHGLWQRRFGSDRGVVGRSTTLDGIPHTIVGVMPAGFAFPGPDIEIWGPLALDPAKITGRSGHFLEVVGRLRPEATLDQVRSEMKVVVNAWSQQYEHSHPMTALTLREQIVGNVRTPLLVLFATVGLVLLIACANVAGLLLARSEGRGREMAIRNALGASRSQLLRQFLTENLLLALIGGTLGFLLAAFSIKLLIALEPGDLPRLEQVAINIHVIAFTLGLSILTTLLFGLLPALRASRPDKNSALKEVAGEAPRGSLRHLLRAGLVVAEIAVATVLVISALLLVRSFWKLQHTEPGFVSENVLTARMFLPRNRYSEPYQIESFFAELTQRLEAIPGVQSASHVDRLPLGQELVVERFEIVGRNVGTGQDAPSTRIQVVDEDFFKTLGIPVLRGRTFTETDDKGAPRAVIINETLARAFFSGESPLDREVMIQASRPREVPFHVVGVVGDIKDGGLNAPTQPTMYVPHRQAVDHMRGLANSATLLVSTSTLPESLVGRLRETIWSLDRELAISDVQSLTTVLDHSVAQPKLTAILLSLFSAIALLLAVVGIYGLIAQLVSQRGHEFGIRFALGARRDNILQLVVSHALILILVGLGIGLILAAGSTRLLVSLLFGVEPTDLTSFLGTALLLAMSALLACYVPARRASRIDPIVALRSRSEG